MLRKKAVDLAQYAKYNSVFYKKLYAGFDPELFEQLPSTDKYALKSAQQLIPQEYKNIILHSETTNGTTSVPLHLYKTTSERMILDMELWKKRWQINKVASKRVAIYSFEEETVRILSRSANSIRVLFPIRGLDHNRLAEHLRIMKSLDIHWVIATSTIAYRLAGVQKKTNIHNGIQVVETNSEYLPRYYRDVIKHVFQCQICVQYGCHEMWGIAFETNEGEGLEVLDSVYIEPEYVGHNLYTFKATNLIVRCMPIIRYEMNDLIKVTDNGIQTYGFRTTDHLTINNKMVRWDEITRLFSSIFSIQYNPLEDYQIIVERGAIRIITINNMTYRDFCERTLEIQKSILAIIGETLNVYIELADGFFCDKKSGKIRGIINNE